MNRFQVYRIKRNGEYMHIRSILSNSLGEAIKKENDKGNGSSNQRYYVSGLMKATGEDISKNFPTHITRRIENKGNKIKFKGTVYQWLNKKSTSKEIAHI